MSRGDHDGQRHGRLGLTTPRVTQVAWLTQSFLHCRMYLQLIGNVKYELGCGKYEEGNDKKLNYGFCSKSSLPHERYDSDVRM